jgi:hypothetical protein
MKIVLFARVRPARNVLVGLKEYKPTGINPEGP